MSDNIFFGHNDLRFLYYRYRDSAYYSIAIFAIVILVCLILIFEIIIPQIGNSISVRNETISLRGQIKNINDNINYVNNIDKSLINSELQTATQALPSENDFTGIINVISSSAIQTGVSVDSFNFNLSSATPGKNQANAAKNYSLISLDIQTSGNLESQKKFLSDILQKIPLSEVTSVDGDSKSLSMVIQFYYKPFPNIQFKEDEPISSTVNLNDPLIQQLSSWQPVSIDQNLNDTTSSSSAAPLF